MSKTKAGIILSAALLIGNVFQFFQSIIIAQFFTPELLAPYKYGVLVASFFPLATLGMIDGLFYFISGKYEKQAGKYVGHTILFCAAVFLVVLLIFHLILKPYALIHTELAPYLDEIGAYVFIGGFIFINLIAHNALVGSDQAATAGILRVFQIGVRFLAVAGGLYFELIQSIYALILLIVFREAAQSLFYALALLKNGLLSFRIRDIEKKAQFNYAVVLGVTRFIPLLNANIDKIMISAMMGASSFAIFAVAAVEIPLAGIVISVFGSVLFSTYVKYAEANEPDRIIALWRKSSIRGMMINVPAGICLFFYSDALFRLLLPEGYFEGHRVLGVYALLLLLRFNDSDVLAKVLNRNSIILKASVLVLITNITGNYIFIESFGLWGAALATLCGLLVAWLYRLTQYARMLETRIDRLFPWQPFVGLAGLSVFSFGGSKMMIHQPLICIALVIAGAVAYIYYAFTLLDENEKSYIRAKLRR